MSNILLFHIERLNLFLFHQDLLDELPKASSYYFGIGRISPLPILTRVWLEGKVSYCDHREALMCMFKTLPMLSRVRRSSYRGKSNLYCVLGGRI